MKRPGPAVQWPTIGAIRTVAGLATVVALALLMVGDAAVAEGSSGRANSGAASQQPEAPATPRKPPPTPVRLDHRRIGCLMSGHYAQFEATIQPLDHVVRVRLYFNSAADEEWWYTEMVLQGNVCRGWLLRPELEGSPITYYILATTVDFREVATPDQQAVVIDDVGDCEPGEFIAPTVRRLPKKH